ncbi:MAG: TfoX/Sxy family protein [Betaproteobacteria bacterium]|jgi:DNA transformation protein|nr:TfoX/Sxy family protein [Betaproteobacteria bacterium]MDH5341557.1 TfoX/Sxy family protein [Betaproteobacteria bacterium]
MRNIGPVSAQWLAAVGIHTVDGLHALGAINAYALVRAHGYNANLNLLWALQGALTDVHSTRIPPAPSRNSGNA